MKRFLVHYKGKGRIIRIPDHAPADEYEQIRQQFAREVRGGTPPADEWDCAHLVRLYPYNRTSTGMYYESCLAGPDGMDFCLIVLPDRGASDVAIAEEELRRARDVCTLKILRIREMV
jgi:hypothetical protein